MSEDVDVDSPEARLDMIRIVLHAIVDRRASPIALAKAGLDLADLTEAQRAEMRGEATAAAASAPDWSWWSGSNDEWYTDGPFATRDQALAALDGDAGYIVEARAALPVRFSAEQLIENQYLENSDSFDCDHAEPDRCGDAAEIVAADAELQALLDHWCDRYAHLFARGNLFSATRNGERIEPAARVETVSTPSAPCPDADAPVTDGDR